MSLLFHIDYARVRRRLVIGARSCEACGRPALIVWILRDEHPAIGHYIECHYCGARVLTPGEVLALEHGPGRGGPPGPAR